MNIQSISKLGKYVVLCLLCSVGYATYAMNPPPQYNIGQSQEIQPLAKVLAEPKYAAMSPEQQLVYILTIFFCEFKIKGHFSEFVKTLITFLQNPTNAAALKQKFPTINIAAIVAVLKKVENDKLSGQIAWKLRNYMNLFPEDLKKMFSPEVLSMGQLDFVSRISKRLMDKN